ncbi:threonylcarbamoyl-AMP synthase [bacterium BMS3Abin03]|nr:threonylcarbamoyl-AMP synthase [bacterium BMS3Abin03]
MSNSTKLINIETDFESAVNEAVKLYENGNVFIYPTDTIYGFGCNPFIREAVDKITGLKARETKKRYILLADSIETVLKYVHLQNEKQPGFLKRIWPNPVSIVLRLNDKYRNVFNHSTAAFRIPDDKFCLSVLSKIKLPMVSTSVNKKDRLPLNNIDKIKNEFDKLVDVIFYTEKQALNYASTLIDLTRDKPVLLREGKIKFVDLIKKFG